MVTKYVLCICDSNKDEKYEPIGDLLKRNIYLHTVLTKYKNKITEHYRNKQWDRYKKLTNEYEQIFTTPNLGGMNICSYNPVSRSFFKMWEMLYDFVDDLNINKNTPINAMFICDSPGGFAEAIVKYRGLEKNKTDKYYGMSLKSVNKNIPDWKFVDKINICYGADNTGDLYNKCNLDWMKDNLPKMDFLSYDGGFDYSNDFNAQEETSLRLILCEIYSALIMQDKNGNCILKIYDIFHENTLKTISFLKQFYKKINIIKPLSSRPANSEKYLVCVGFNNSNNESIKLIELLGKLISNYTPKMLNEFLDNIQHNPCVLHNLICYNVYYTLRQIYYIEQTIAYINEFGKTYHDPNTKEQLRKITELHKAKAILWCKKYNLPHV